MVHVNSGSQYFKDGAILKEVGWKKLWKFVRQTSCRNFD